MNLLLAQNWKDSLSAGQQAFQDKQYTEAFRLFKNAQDLAPKGVDIKELMNQAAYKGKNYSEAAKGYADALKQAKTDEAKTTGNYNLGNAQFKNKDVDAAIESYKNALRANPTNEQARYNLAYAMNQKNQNDKNKNEQDQNKKNQDQNKQNQNKGNNDSNKNKPQPNDPNKGNEGENKNSQPKPDQLSQDQTDRLLDAMAKSDQNAQKKLDKSKDTIKAILNTKKKDW
jgi:tetratricopeptide (TPR) repeat protein